MKKQLTHKEKYQLQMVPDRFDLKKGMFETFVEEAMSNGGILSDRIFADACEAYDISEDRVMKIMEKSKDPIFARLSNGFTVSTLVPEPPFLKGDQVIRVSSDYTNGRRGKVIELGPQKTPDSCRARVLWTETASGNSMKLRTWVNFKQLKKI